MSESAYLVCGGWRPGDEHVVYSPAATAVAVRAGEVAEVVDLGALTVAKAEPTAGAYGH